MPELIVPAPWGLGIVLGLHSSYTTTACIAHRGPLLIVQERRQGDLKGAVRHLQELAKTQGQLGPEMTAPWAWAYEPGPVGVVDLVEVLRVADQRWVAYEWKFANPRPAWAAAA